MREQTVCAGSSAVDKQGRKLNSAVRCSPGRAAKAQVPSSAPCFVDKNAVHGKNLGKHIVFRGFLLFFGQKRDFYAPSKQVSILCCLLTVFNTVREKYEPRLLRHLLRALPFIVFAILGYCRILFAANHPKILPQKVQSNQKLYILRSGAAKGAARAVWHGQAFQQCITAKSTLLIGFAFLPYSIITGLEPCDFLGDQFFLLENL